MNKWEILMKGISFHYCFIFHIKPFKQYISWWSSSSEYLGSVEYPSIAITPRSTLQVTFEGFVNLNSFCLES